MALRSAPQKEIIVPQPNEGLFSLMMDPSGALKQLESMMQQSELVLPAMNGAKAADRLTHDPHSEAVFLAPGYGMSSWALNKVGSSIYELGQNSHPHGIDVIHADFSWSGSTREIRSRISDQLMRVLDTGKTLHLVTHSLGGPLMVEIVRDIPDISLGTIHFINSPHKGITYVKNIAHSEIIDHFMQKGERIYDDDHILEGVVREIHGYVSQEDEIIRAEDQLSGNVDSDVPSTDRIYVGDRHTTLLVGRRAHQVANEIVNVICTLCRTKKKISRITN